FKFGWCFWSSGVARILSHEGGVTDVEVLQAALLHDTVEDTDTTPTELEAKFGPVVARIVQEVTDDKSLPKRERKRAQVEHAAQCSRQAKLVKLADKLYNLRDLNRCTPVGQSGFSSHLERMNGFHQTSVHIMFCHGLCV
uniref:HD domain containing 3 n=1 Tax=Oryzias sinensis TaxID=183150 RepID=A0A8C7WWK7_9TELE